MLKRHTPQCDVELRGCWRHLIFHQPAGRLTFAFMTESETQPGGYVQTPGGVDCNRTLLYQYLLDEHDGGGQTNADTARS